GRKVNVIRYSMRRLAFFCIFLGVASSALGQGWPLPSKSQNTTVPCPASSLACAGKENLLTVGYSDPIKTFVGRYLDSQATKEYQFPLRTLRARLVRVAPELNRIYMIQGSTAVGYDLPSFFSRLTAGEAMAGVTVRP